MKVMRTVLLKEYRCQEYADTFQTPDRTDGKRYC